MTCLNRVRHMALVGLIASGMTLSPAFAQENRLPENIITTSGQGQVEVKPDSLRVNVMVESTDDDVEDARSENNRKMQAIIASLKALNIPALKLETQGVQVYPIYPKSMTSIVGSARKPSGYRVTNNLEAKVVRANVDNLSTYGSRIMDAALDAGANNVHGLSFYLDDVATAQAAALRDAMQNARQNADVMAQSAGLTITGVHSIEGNPQYGYHPRPMPMMAKAMSSSDAVAESVPVETGETSVSANVMVRYRF